MNATATPIQAQSGTASCERRKRRRRFRPHSLALALGARGGRERARTEAPTFAGVRTALLTAALAAVGYAPAAFALPAPAGSGWSAPVHYLSASGFDGVPMDFGGVDGYVEVVVCSEYGGDTPCAPVPTFRAQAWNCYAVTYAFENADADCYWRPLYTSATAGDVPPANPAYTPPTPAEAAEAFTWGISGVISCYLVAWGCAQVLAMVKAP